MLAERAGAIIANVLTVTLSGTPAIGTYATCTGISFIDHRSITFSGSATGTRYNAQSNSVINTGGGGASYLPGNSAGSTATGAQYL